MTDPYNFIETYIDTQFSVERWLEERRSIYGPIDNLDKVITVDDHLRLPGNINIIDFLYEMTHIFDKWMAYNNYTGEKIVLTPKYPDIIYPSDTVSGMVTADSPQAKQPPSITFEVERKEPESVNPPFGARKNWKFRTWGDVKGIDDKWYRIKMKRYESMVRFTIFARTIDECEKVRYIFDTFMTLCGSQFLKLGIEAMVFFDWGSHQSEISKTGLHSRVSRYWFRTQEFAIIGPFDTIVPRIFVGTGEIE